MSAPGSRGAWLAAVCALVANGCACPPAAPEGPRLPPSAMVVTPPSAPLPALVRESSVPLPATESTAFACAALGGWLHVVFADAGQRQSTHAVFDLAGSALRPPVTTPLLVWGMVPCGDHLLASASKHGDDRPRVARIAANGDVVWQAEVPVPQGSLLWPVPICEGGRGLLVWRTEAENGALSWVDVAADGVGPVSSVPLPEMTWEVALAPAPRGFVALRTDPRALELLHMETGEVERAFLDTRDLSGFSVAAAGGRFGVWTVAADSNDVRLQWFGEKLAPEGRPLALVRAPEQIHSVRVTPGDAGTSIVRAYASARTARTAAVPGGRHEPVTEAREYVGVHDAGQTRMTDLLAVENPGGVDCGAWLSDRFALISGKRDITLTTYRVSRP